MSGRLLCRHSHEFSIVCGVPKLSPGAAPQQPLAEKEADGTDQSDQRAVAASFSQEWAHFDYTDRTWSLELQARCALALRELDCRPEALNGKLLLDAGCGNGALSRAFNRFGCEVVGIDISDSVDKAFAHFAATGNARTHFIHGDLLCHPLRTGVFDVVYSSGVLHHNRDTRQAFVSIAGALKPGGRMYVWVYHKRPGVRHALRQLLRACLAPLPSPVKHGLVCMWLPQAMLRQYLRSAFGRSAPNDRLKWRERLVLLLDHYTPRYRWEHTQEEVHGWYREARFTDIRTTEVREWGFGVLGYKHMEGRPSSG